MIRKPLLLLCLVAAALCAPADPAPPQLSQDAPSLAPRAPFPASFGAERQDVVSKLEPSEAGATDDLKPEASFWGGYGWGYRPQYYGYYRPRSYYQPYWGGYSGGYGWRGGFGWGGGYWG